MGGVGVGQRPVWPSHIIFPEQNVDTITSTDPRLQIDADQNNCRYEIFPEQFYGGQSPLLIQQLL